MKNLFMIFAVAIFAAAFMINCQSIGSVTLNDTSTEPSFISVPDHFNTVVGQIVNQEYVLDEDIDDLVSNWEDKINNTNSFNLDFDDVYIELDGSEYFLVGLDSSENAKSKIRLVLDSQTFYEISYPGPNPESAPNGSTCTCTGCTSTGPASVNDCIPKQNAPGWYCTDCPRGFGECTKTVTVTSGAGVLE